MILKYLALGDSYTIGEGVPEKETWPVLLAEALRDRGIKIQDPRIVAKTGWTTSELQQAIQNEELENDYDLVSLLIGVNNQYRGLNINDYHQEFTDLLQSSISLAKNDNRNVFVVSIPDYSITSFARDKNPEKIRKELENFNKVNKEVAGKLEVAYLDITPLSQQAQYDSSLLAEDQLHPSGKMYRQWVALMAPLLLKRFLK